MNPTYIIRVGDEEQGPYPFEDLEMYEQIGEISPMTKVRLDGHDVWKEWGAIKAAASQQKERVVVYSKFLAPSSPTKKHSVLKIIVGFWIVCSALAGIGGIIWIASGLALLGTVSLVGSAITVTICGFIFKALDE